MLYANRCEFDCKQRPQTMASRAGTLSDCRKSPRILSLIFVMSDISEFDRKSLPSKLSPTKIIITIGAVAGKLGNFRTWQRLAYKISSAGVSPPLITCLINLCRVFLQSCQLFVDISDNLSKLFQSLMVLAFFKNAQKIKVILSMTHL